MHGSAQESVVRGGVESEIKGKQGTQTGTTFDRTDGQSEVK